MLQMWSIVRVQKQQETFRTVNFFFFKELIKKKPTNKPKCYHWLRKTLLQIPGRWENILRFGNILIGPWHDTGLNTSSIWSSTASTICRWLWGTQTFKVCFQICDTGTLIEKATDFWWVISLYLSVFQAPSKWKVSPSKWKVSFF